MYSSIQGHKNLKRKQLNKDQSNKKKSSSVVVLRTLSTGVFSPSVAENQWSRPSRTAGG